MRAFSAPLFAKQSGKRFMTIFIQHFCLEAFFGKSHPSENSLDLLGLMRVNASEFIPSVSWDATSKRLGENINISDEAVDNGEGAL